MPPSEPGHGVFVRPTKILSCVRANEAHNMSQIAIVPTPANKVGPSATHLIRRGGNLVPVHARRLPHSAGLVRILLVR